MGFIYTIYHQNCKIDDTVLFQFRYLTNVNKLTTVHALSYINIESILKRFLTSHSQTLDSFHLNFLISFNFCSRHSWPLLWYSIFIMLPKTSDSIHVSEWLLYVMTALPCVLPCSFLEKSSFHISSIPHVSF